MNNNFLLLIFIPALLLIFIFTKASFYEFILGFGLCLLGQAILIICYCIFKVQHALLDSTRIKLQQSILYPYQIDYQLNVQKQFPFKTRKENLKIFLNKYTEQEKLEIKKNTLKVHSFQNYLSEDEILSQEPKKQIIHYLNEKKHEHKIYNIFNIILIKFGKSLKDSRFKSQNFLLQGKLDDIPVIGKKKYSFQEIENTFESELPQNQLQNFERQILDDLEIKIKIKKDQEKNILFPSWTMMLEGLSYIGKQFQKISQMHESNQQIIEMINGKLVEDFQFIQNQIKKALKSLDQIQKTSQQLKKQNQQFLTSQRDGRAHQMDLMFLLKQQYYKFQDFQLRIKENEKNYHIQTKKLSYFRQKLSSFYNKNRIKYEKIFKTRFFAILDSYNITIQESLKALRKVLCLNHQFILSKPPKVSKLQILKNMDQQLEAEKFYQDQYFSRAKYYLKKSQHLTESIKDQELFLQRLKLSFEELYKGLKVCQLKIKKNPEYNKNFNLGFIIKFYEAIGKFLFQINHLYQLQLKFVEKNQSYLQISQSRIQTSIDDSQKYLSNLFNLKSAIQHKYRFFKLLLQQKYLIIENQINEIKRFEQIYKKHSIRLKKVLTMEFLNFFYLQKMYLNQSDFMKKTFENAYHINNDLGNDEDDKEDNYPFQLEEASNHIDNIYTGQYLSQEYIKLLNRFLFAAYNEWKNSQLFKETLSKQLYIMLNKEPNQNLSEVIIENLELTGYPPEIMAIKELHSEQFQFLADLSIAFKGKIIMFLKTQYKLMAINFPTEVKVQFEEFYCTLRLCFVPAETGQSWFSFIGEPIAKFTLDPNIYSIKINAQTIRNFFSNLILKKLKQSTFPIRQKILIPVSKQEDLLQQIQKRFKAKYQF